MESVRIRQRFIDYFAARGHQPVPSSPLVPADDPTLLFTNAGMVQFKRTFLGQERRPYHRAVTVQKCVRAGGKHNDLEQVGHTARHHTFFEMLGNFSFGDYFKRDAIAFAWEWVTAPEWLGLHPDRLTVTVHETDDEAAGLWHEVAGVPHDRIHRLGDKDNFWQMGDTGPCGPCSEIYVDLAWRPGQPPAVLDRAAFEAEAESGRFLEIWNLVFMQFDRGADGTLTPLPKPSVDTGAGLERIAAIMQGTDSNFHTDLFLPLLDRVAALVGRPYDRGPGGASYRVLADHARAVSFLLADGVYPSNDGRGYVLRRILRRAVRHAWLLGRREPTLAPLTGLVVAQLGEVYPELRERAGRIRELTEREERRFLDTIEGGLARLEELFASGARTIGGDEAFRLYDTFGFPIDLTALIGAERGVGVDQAGFEVALEEQRTRSREATRAARGGGGVQAGGAPEVHVPAGARQAFTGYTDLRAESRLLGSALDEGRAALVLEQNPFYVESGGQVSDTGTVEGPGWRVVVDEVRRGPSGAVVSGPLEGELDPSGVVVAEVDAPRRRDIERNHSATHLVHMVLRRRLGDHVRQQGSLVAPDRLRFDFAHHAPIDPAQLAEIEQEVNELAWRNDVVDIREMPYADALALGAMAFFADKYGDVVRVVTIGDSIELCGGTHVRSAGQVGLFRLASQGGVAAGVRRIEALTGPGAYAALRALDAGVAEAAGALRAQPEQLARRAEQLVEERDKLAARIQELLRSGGGGLPSAQTLALDGVTLHLGETDAEDRDELGLMADRFREGRSGAVLLLFSGSGRGAIHAAVTDDLVQSGRKAGDLVARVAAVSGGKGGGRPHFASAGAGDPGRLPEARAAAPALVASWLRGER